MRNAYKYLCYLLALEVVVQSAAIAYFSFGFGSQSGDSTGGAGFDVHSVNGGMVMPVLALALLVAAFVAKVPRGPAVAGVLLVCVVAQVALGYAGGGSPALGAVHGLLALVIFAGAMHAARLAARPAASEAVPVGVGGRG